MNERKRIAISLLTLRIGVFIVMLVWTLDKFLSPEHAARVYEKYYFIPGVGATAFYIMATIELLIILGFLFGYQKRITYGLVFIFHAISTLSSFKMYLMAQLIFFAAWPMLAACFALYYLRDLDTMWVIEKQGTP